jgi:hypothetical protein
MSASRYLVRAASLSFVGRSTAAPQLAIINPRYFFVVAQHAAPLQTKLSFVSTAWDAIRVTTLALRYTRY